MTPEELANDPHMAPEVLSKGIRNASFSKGYAEFETLYKTHGNLQKFSLPLDFADISTPQFWDLHSGLFVFAVHIHSI